jgi:hypothetical protein
MAVKPRGELIRAHSEPSATDMSMLAWPSIWPRRPRSACRRASSTSQGRRKARKASASRTTMMGPPTNSARVNCQPISSARMMPSSTTRLVEAISKAIAAVKSAPLRKIDLARATAAYEQELDAAPSPHASARVRGRSSGSSRVIWRLDTTDCTIADSIKPRISAQVISQVIPNASRSACSTPPPLLAREATVSTTITTCHRFGIAYIGIAYALRR